MDFNIDDIVSKYLEPLKNGVDLGSADISASEEKEARADVAVPEPEKKAPEYPAAETATAYVVEPETPPEPETADFEADLPENLSDFLKEIIASSAKAEEIADTDVEISEVSDTEAEPPAAFDTETVSEPERVTVGLPYKEVSKPESVTIEDLSAEDGFSSDVSEQEPSLPAFDDGLEYDDLKAENKRKSPLFNKFRSHKNKPSYQSDEFDDFSDFPIRKNESDAAGISETESVEGNTADGDFYGEQKNYKEAIPDNDIKVAPTYKVFEPEKYVVDADADKSDDEEAYFRKSTTGSPEKPKGFEKYEDLPEERTAVIKDLSRRPAAFVEDESANRSERQETTSPTRGRTDKVDDLRSRYENIDVKRSDDENTKPKFIDRTALIGNLFSKFAKVELDAETDVGVTASKTEEPEEEPVHNVNEQHTMVFSPDPVPSHMTEPAERAGIETEKNSVRVFHTGELQPLHEFSGGGTRNRVSITGDFPMKEEIAEPLEGQMSFFEFPEQEPEDQIDEDAVEQDVKYRRLEKVKNFRLIKEFEDMDSESGDLYNRADEVFGDEEPGEEKYPGNIPEYVLESDRRKIGWFMLKERRKKSITTAILAFITFCFILLEILPRISGSLNNAIGAGTFANSITSFILVTLAAIASVDNVVAGMDSIFIRRSPDGRSVGLIALIMVIIQSLISMFVRTDGKIGLLAGSVAFVLLINSIASGLEHERVMHNFKFCAYTGKKSLNSVVTVSGEQERREIGQALSIDDPTIKYSCKVNFPRRFVELSSKNRITDKHGITLIAITFAIGILLSILCGVRGGPYYALSGITAAFCAAIPIAEYFSVTNELKRSCENLNKSGGMISSLGVAQKCGETNAVIIDAAELIDKNGCEMHGMKDFKNVRLDDILLYTAALVIKSEGPLSEVFKDMVMDAEDVLPSVSSISFEENLGVSGWIHGQKVLLGNRNLMAAHNIAVPTHREEATYCVNDRKVLYVAIADKLAAMFVVSYAVDMSKAEYLHCFERNNITVLIDSCDPNVSEELIEAGFGLEYGSIKIISSIAGRIFRRLKDNFFKKADAAVMHDGKSESFLRSIATAVSLRNAAKFISVAQLVVAILSLLVMIALAITSRFLFINAWFIIVINIVSMVIFSLIGRFFRI